MGLGSLTVPGRGDRSRPGARVPRGSGSPHEAAGTGAPSLVVPVWCPLAGVRAALGPLSLPRPWPACPAPWLPVLAPAPTRGPAWGRPCQGAQGPPCCCRRPAGTWRPRWCASTGAVTSPAASSPWPTSTPVSPPARCPMSRGLQPGAGLLSMCSRGLPLAQCRGRRPGGGPRRVGASGGGGLHLWVPARVHACVPPINSVLVARASVQCRTWCSAQRGRGGVQGHWALPEPVPTSLVLPVASRC